MPRPEPMPKKSPRKPVKMGTVVPQAHRHVGRVNQKMIDQMIRMRREGVTHAQNARRLGASENTVRRPSEGGSPHLVHAAEEKQGDLLYLGALQMRVNQQ